MSSLHQEAFEAVSIFNPGNLPQSQTFDECSAESDCERIYKWYYTHTTPPEK